MIDINKKYTTRNGNAVRIYATDGAGNYPVQGAMFEPDTGWLMERWSSFGSCWGNEESGADLIEVKEPEQEERDVDALQAELDAALRVAFNRGATEYVRKNYPEKYGDFAMPERVTLYQGLEIEYGGSIVDYLGFSRSAQHEWWQATHILRLDITGDDVTATVEKVGG